MVDELLGTGGQDGVLHGFLLLGLALDLLEQDVAGGEGEPQGAVWLDAVLFPRSACAH